MNVLICLCLSGVVTLGVAAGAVAQQSAAPQDQRALVQLFGCSLQEGSSMDDIWNVVESWRGAVEQMELPQDPQFGAFLWTAFRTASPYDLIWGVVSSDLPSLGRAFSVYYGSEAGPNVEQEFLSHVDCESAIVFSEQVSQGRMGTVVDRQPDALVDTFVCRLNDNATQQDLRDAVAFWQQQVSAIGSDALDQYEAFLLTPYRGGSGDWDFAWVGNYPDYPTWGQGESDYYGSEQGQQAEQRFLEISRCESGLWNGYWALVPETVSQAQSAAQ